jgi:toxin secretion/phage lysis holin
MHLEPINYDVDAWLIIMPCVFILLDVASGLYKAVATRSLSSSKMRDGLFHKGAFVFFIVLAIMCEAFMQHVDLGISVPLVQTVAVYISLTEITSILENLGEAFPSLQGSRLMSIFQSTKDGATGATDATDGKAA